MDVLRRRLSWIACGWFCCQLSLLTAAPLSLLAHAPGAADAIACTCMDTGHDACPMHHPAAKKPACECRNTTDPDAASIVSILGPTAVLAAAPAHVAPPPITQLPTYPLSRFTSFIASPDGPPPRA